MAFKNPTCLDSARSSFIRVSAPVFGVFSRSMACAGMRIGLWHNVMQAGVSFLLSQATAFEQPRAKNYACLRLCAGH